MNQKRKTRKPGALRSTLQRLSASLLTKNMAASHVSIVVNSTRTNPSASLGYFLLLIKTASVAFLGGYAPRKSSDFGKISRRQAKKKINHIATLVSRRHYRASQACLGHVITDRRLLSNWPITALISTRLRLAAQFIQSCFHWISKRKKISFVMRWWNDLYFPVNWDGKAVFEERNAFGAEKRVYFGGGGLSGSYLHQCGTTAQHCKNTCLMLSAWLQYGLVNKSARFLWYFNVLLDSISCFVDLQGTK